MIRGPRDSSHPGVRAGSAGGRPWQPASWRAMACEQQPEWPDREVLDQAEARLRTLPGLVTPRDVRALRERLAGVCAGRGFVIQAGDCAETFAEMSPTSVHRTVRVLAEMESVIGLSTGIPVTKIGRIAGQLAKPRSSPVEHIAGPAGPLTVPSYRGDMVNGSQPTAAARMPAAERLVQAYYHSAAVLNVLRALAQGGHQDLAGDRRRPAAATSLYTSHEALILPYEEALIRPCPEGASGPESGGLAWYGSSAHLLWVGERTRRLDQAHVEFARGLANPVAVKLGPTTTRDEVLGLCQLLNPARIPGRLTLIPRLGAGEVRVLLPELVHAVQAAREPVVWVCDPMHANTFASAAGLKTRHFDDIVAETEGFFAVLYAAGARPGGLHVEMTGQDVTECLGGLSAIREGDLPERYETACDPRLNRAQAIELALIVADLLHAGPPQVRGPLSPISIPLQVSSHLEPVAATTAQPAGSAHLWPSTSADDRSHDDGLRPERGQGP